MSLAARAEAKRAFADQSGANIESQYVVVLAVRGALDEDFSTGTGGGGLIVCLSGAARADAGTCGDGRTAGRRLPTREGGKGELLRGMSAWRLPGVGGRQVRSGVGRRRGVCRPQESGMRAVRSTKRNARSLAQTAAAPVTYCSPCRRSSSSRSRCSGSWVSSSAQVSRSSIARWQPSRTRSRSTGTPLASAN